MERRIFEEVNDVEIDYHETWELNTHGRIVTPGKFQGERSYIPYLWQWVLEGDCDTVWDNTLRVDVERVEVGDDLREHWPYLKHAKYVFIFESNDGFVYSWLEYLDGKIEKHNKIQRKDWE